MISFLVAIDKFGMITGIIWSNPAYIVSSIGQSIYELFIDIDRFLLGEILYACSKRKDNTCEISLRLKSFPGSVNLCAASVNDRVLVLGLDAEFCRESPNEKLLSEVIPLFMEALIESSEEHSTLNTENARLQFEKIQYLNNELINTKRMLEKANGKLNALNKDLNNRLVKDALTGLVSRYQYRAEIEICIARHPEGLGIFVFIDIDDFKSINDTYGHRMGDKYLVEFAKRLDNLPISDSVKMRISGDEFGLFVYNLQGADTKTMKEIWEIIQKGILDIPVIIDGDALPLTISAGMSIYGKDTREIYDLIDYADFAMYQAKRSGKNNFKGFVMEEYAALKTR